MPIVLSNDAAAREMVLTAGLDAHGVGTRDALEDRLTENPDEVLVVVGDDIDLEEAISLTIALRVSRPSLGVVLIRRRLDSSMLRQALRAGVRDVVRSGDAASLMEALRRSQEVSHAVAPMTDAGRVQPSTGPAQGVIVTVFSAKGGCGKTTVATNLAVTFAKKRGLRVCLVDLDLAFGDVAITAQLVPRRTMADAAALAGNIDESAVRSLTTPYGHGVDALLAPAEPGVADGVTPAVVTEVLTVLRAMYDVVVVDTPPAFNDHVLAAFDQTDQFVLLATLDVPAVKNLKLTLETMDVLHYASQRWHVVINRADSKVGLSLSDVAGALKLQPAAEIPSSRAVPSATNRGVPIVVDLPTHAVSSSIRKLADRLVMPSAAQTEPVSKHKADPVPTTRRALPRLRRGEATT